MCLRLALPLFAFVVFALSCGSDDYGGGPAANATIYVASTEFTVGDWHYALSTNANAGKVVIAASNGNTCALLANPNAPDVRLVRVAAFSYTDISTGDTVAPSGPGQYPVVANAALGPAGTAWFYATGDQGQPLVLTQTSNPTEPVATDGNVTLTAFDPHSSASVVGSAQGTVTGSQFYYTFTASPCP